MFQIKMAETVTSGNNTLGVNTGENRLKKYAGQVCCMDVCPETHGSQRSSQKQNKNKQTKPQDLYIHLHFPLILSSQIIKLIETIMLGRHRNEEFRLLDEENLCSLPEFPPFHSMALDIVVQVLNAAAPTVNQI